MNYPRPSDSDSLLLIILLWTVSYLNPQPGFKVQLQGTDGFPAKLPPEAERRWGMGGGGSLGKGTWVVLEHQPRMRTLELQRKLAFEPPPCPHTCLLCPSPRTQLSQPRVTYPHMSGSAAFPTLVNLVAQASVTVGSKGRCESIPGVHPSVCHTQPTAFGKLLICKRSLEEVVGTKGGALYSWNTRWIAPALGRPPQGGGHMCFFSCGWDKMSDKKERKERRVYLDSQF